MCAKLAKVRPGQVLSIPADTWNAMIDAANVIRRNQLNLLSSQNDNLIGEVRVRNRSGVAVLRYGALCICDAPLVELFDADYTDGPHGIQTLGIATTPIPVSGLGRAWTAGIHPVIADDYASVAVGDRLNTQADEFDLVIDYMGPFKVLKKLTSPIVIASFEPHGIPPLLKTTAAESGGEIPAKQVTEAFAVTGDNRTFLTQ